MEDRFKFFKKGQTALEYLLLLGLVAFVVFTAFSGGGFMNQVKDSSTNYFTTMGRVIQGEDPKTGINGGWCEWSLCSGGIQFRTCECPAPAFGGAQCVADSQGGASRTCGGASLPTCGSGQRCNLWSNPCQCPSGSSCSALGYCATQCTATQDCTSVTTPCYCPAAEVCNNTSKMCESGYGYGYGTP